MGSCSGSRGAVWGLWGVNLLISSVYLGLSLTSFHNVRHGVKFLGNFPNREAYKTSLLASCMLGFLIVLFWVIFSFIVLLGRFFGRVATSYGVMLGSASHTGAFMLLAGLVLQTHDNLAQQFKTSRIWRGNEYDTYVATYVFNYVLTASYWFMFLVLLLAQGAMKTEEKADKYAASVPPSTSTAAAGTAPSAAAATAPSPADKPSLDSHGFGSNWKGTNWGSNV